MGALSTLVPLFSVRIFEELQAAFRVYGDGGSELPLATVKNYVLHKGYRDGDIEDTIDW